MTNAVVFVVAFAVGVLWYRVGFLIFQDYLKRPLVRRTSGLRWHHLHHGAVLALLGVILELLGANHTVVYILLGVGLGFVVDEFFLFLHLETERDEEIKVYHKTLAPTLYLLFAITAAILLLGYLFI